jgi:hypothetical protein
LKADYAVVGFLLRDVLHDLSHVRCATSKRPCPQAVRGWRIRHDALCRDVCAPLNRRAQESTDRGADMPRKARLRHPTSRNGGAKAPPFRPVVRNPRWRMLWARAGVHIENRPLGAFISAYNSWASCPLFNQTGAPEHLFFSVSGLEKSRVRRTVLGSDFVPEVSNLPRR